VATNDDFRRALYQNYQSLMKSDVTRPDNPDRRRRLIGWKLRNWLPENKHSVIFDAGCGRGEALDCLRQMGYTCLAGVDLSPEQVEVARLKGLPVEQVDVLDYLSTETARYDLIIAMDMVEHLEPAEMSRFMELCFKSLKLGGRLVIHTVNPASPFFGESFYGDPTHSVAISPALMRNLLSLTGFVQIQFRRVGPVPLGYSLQSSARYLLWMIFEIFFQLAHIVETGATAECLTRNYLVSAIKFDKTTGRYEI